MNICGCYVACNKDRYVLSKSSSGGAFSSFADYILNNGGVVLGATFDELEKKVKHIGITKKSELDKLRKSKYVFSDFLDSFGVIEKAIINNKYILFTGTPCQAAAIKAKYADYDRLFVVDLFCHGTLEPAYLMEYLDSLDTEIKDVRFREQEHESKDNFQFCIYDNSGLIVSDVYINNPLTYIFLTSEGIRDACFSCRYASRKHISDITIGDWIFDYPNEWNEIYNFIHPSIVVVNNEKGKDLFDACSESFYSYEMNNDNKELNWYYCEHKNMSGLWGYDSERKELFNKMKKEKGFIYSAEYSMYERERDLIEKALKIGNAKICLYGCGNNGKRLSKVINRYYYDRVELQYFIVTENTKRINAIDNKKVYQLKDVYKDLYDKTVVITVGKEDMRKEIEKTLIEKGITNYVCW